MPKSISTDPTNPIATRLKYLRAFAWAGAIAEPPAWIITVIFSRFVDYFVVPISFITCVVILRYVRTPKQIDIATRLFAALFVLPLSIGFCITGNLALLYALYPCLLVAFLLNDRRTGALWTIVSSGIVLGGLILSQMKLIPVDLNVHLVLTFCLCLVAFGIVAFIFDTIRQDYEAALKAAKASVEAKVVERTEELHTEQVKLKSSIESLRDGFIMVDDHNQIILRNTAVDTILGVSPRHWTFSLLTKHLGSFNSAGLEAAAYCDQIRHGDRTGRIERIVTADNKILRVFLAPVTYHQDATGIVILIEDITEQEVLARSKDEFFSIASHELRTPLTAIRGNMSMIKDYFPDAMKDESLASTVTDTHDASVRLIAIVNDFLDSSRLEQGKMEFTLKPTIIKPLIDTVLKDLTPLLEEHHNKYVLSGIDTLPPLYADGVRLQQILYNIIGNAIKYTENGTVTVEAKIKGRNAHILVTDTGLGISAKNQRILFHKFQQATDSILTRTDTKGTGLGLYISKLIATNIGGDVALVNSEVGEGSTFLLRLPLATASQLKAAANDEAAK